MNNILPIGTIVNLKDVSKRILIVGYLPKEIDSETFYDYSAVPFPEGLIDSKQILLINHNQIDKIYNKIDQDEEVIDILTEIAKAKEK